MGAHDDLIPVEGALVVLEPGDGTHYEFAVLPHYRESDTVFIASVGSVAFSGYAFSLSELRHFAASYPWIKSEDDGGAASGAYRALAIGDNPMGEQLVGYIVSHAKCNPWTALAAIRAALWATKGL